MGRRIAPSLRRNGYNARVDRLNAIRLLQALVAAGRLQADYAT
jgi:hypothetical protein